MNRRAIIISIVIVFVTAVSIFLYIFVFSMPSPPPASPGSVPGSARLQGVSRESEARAPENEAVAIPSVAGGGRADKIEFFGSTFQLPAFVKDTFGPLLPIPTEIKQLSSPQNQPLSSSSGSSVSAPTQPRRVLTEEEIFSIIWPKYYRDYLFEMRGLMVSDGFISPDKHAAFTADKEVYDFVKSLDAYAFSKGWITEEDYKNFIRGVDEILPPLVEQEKGDLRAGKRSSNALPGGQRFVRAGKLEILRDLLDGFAFVFFQAKPVDAKWVTKDDCYKDDNPADKELGENLVTICCNCGFRCTNYCVFVEDCGTNGAACDTQIGCLNGVCENKQNAIWDEKTGICGCG